MSAEKLTYPEWRAIPGAEGYEVSSIGEVRSIPRIKRHSRYGLARYAGRMLRPAPNADGYPRVNIGGKHCFVHVLVLRAFVGECPPGMQACHSDGNRANPSLDNLRWDTPKANVADRRAHGTYQYGRRNPCSRDRLEGRGVRPKNGAWGITFNKDMQKWVAQTGGVYLGKFNTKEEAAEVSRRYWEKVRDMPSEAAA